jgi:nucleoside-diphosphate-sugar epimerase
VSFWTGKRVTITGGSGFLGSHIVDRLGDYDCQTFAPRKADYDFTRFADCLCCFRQYPADLVIHSAACYGGIGFNQRYAARICYENLVMSSHLFEAARLAGVQKLVTIGTAASYPGYLEGELKEDNFWDGIPHETVIAYGLTKKMMAVQGLAYKKQYNFNSIHLVLTNLYGPRDIYNPERSHVVAALIRKWVEAKMAGACEVEVWGTGTAIREFLYVADCAEAILRAAQFYESTEPLNIGTGGTGTSIRELAETINSIVEFKGRIVWNTSKSDGQAKKILDVTRMKEALHWQPCTDLREGLAKAIEWYSANKEEADQRL